MLGCKPIDSPTKMNHRLTNEDGKLANKEQYQKLVGKLNYLSNTRPDMAYELNILSQFMQNLCSSHLEAVFRILRYLKSSPRYLNYNHLH